MSQPDLYRDLLANLDIRSKVQASDIYAQNLYAALCNNEFEHNTVIGRLRNDRWSCSWRFAGSIIADIKGHGDYLDYYCTGLQPIGQDHRTDEFVSEGVVSQEVRDDLYNMGWIVIERTNE